MHILQINFQVAVSCHTYITDCAPVAEVIAKTPGLVWMAWTFNEKNSLAGGFYLFESKAAMDAYVESPIIQGLKQSPAFSHVTVNRFDLLPELSKITRFDLEQQMSHGRVLAAVAE